MNGLYKSLWVIDNMKSHLTSIRNYWHSFSILSGVSSNSFSTSFILRWDANYLKSLSRKMPIRSNRIVLRGVFLHQGRGRSNSISHDRYLFRLILTSIIALYTPTTEACFTYFLSPASVLFKSSPQAESQIQLLVYSLVRARNSSKWTWMLGNMVSRRFKTKTR